MVVAFVVGVWVCGVGFVTGLPGLVGVGVVVGGVAVGQLTAFSEPEVNLKVRFSPPFRLRLPVEAEGQ